MAETVSRMDVFQSFSREGFFEIFPADSINAVTRYPFFPLIDEKPVLKRRLWRYSVFADIELKQFNGFRFKADNAITVPLSQNGQCLLLRIEVVQFYHGSLAGPGARVIEEMQDCIVPEAFFSIQIDRLEEVKDFLLIEKTDERFLGTFLRNIDDPVSDFTMFRLLQGWVRYSGSGYG